MFINCYWFYEYVLVFFYHLYICWTLMIAAIKYKKWHKLDFAILRKVVHISGLANAIAMKQKALKRVVFVFQYDIKKVWPLKSFDSQNKPYLIVPLLLRHTVCHWIPDNKGGTYQTGSLPEAVQDFQLRRGTPQETPKCCWSRLFNSHTMFVNGFWI